MIKSHPTTYKVSNFVVRPRWIPRSNGHFLFGMDLYADSRITEEILFDTVSTSPTSVSSQLLSDNSCLYLE